MMLRLVGWTATIAVSATLIWLSAAMDPYWARVASAALLAIFGVLVGIRLGTDSSSKYTTELQRLNKVLVEQNRGLEDANSILLKELSAESRTPSKSA
jgi:hypothetical protein